MAGKIKGITIEFLGDSSKLGKALADIESRSKGVDKELKEINKSLKFNPGNSDLLVQKQEALQSAVKNTSEKLGHLKEAQKEAQEAFERGELPKEEYNQLTREVLKTENQLERFENQLKEVNRELKHNNETMQKAAEKFEAFGGKAQAVGTALSKGVTAPIVGVGAASAMAFKELDEGLDVVAVKTGATGKEMRKLENTFKQVYKELPVSAAEAGEAIGEVKTQFALNGKELKTISEQLLKFAQINNQDVTSSTINAKQAMEQFGLDSKAIPMILDAVTKTAQNTGVATGKLFDTVIKGAPQLKSMGLQFAEATALVGGLEQKGYDSSKAIMALTKAQGSWAKKGLSMQDGLSQLQDRLGKAKTEQDKLAIATEVFGTRGGAMMLKALEDGALSAEALGKAMGDAKGAVSATFDETLDPADEFAKTLNELKTLGYDIANAVGPVLVPVAQKLSKTIQKISRRLDKMSPMAKKVITIIALIAASVGPLLILIGKMSTGVGAVVKVAGAASAAISGIGGAAGIAGGAMTLLTGPVGIAIAAIGGLIAVGVLLYKNWDKIKEKARKVGASVVKTWENIKKGVEVAIKGVQKVIKSVFKIIKTFIELELLGWAKLFELGLSGITKVVDVVWGAVEKKIVEPIRRAKKKIKSGLNEIKGFFKNLKLPEIKIPKIKLPHFKVKGEFGLAPPKAPKFDVDWYDRGGIFTGPQIIGVGEKRPEFVGALEDLKTLMVEAIQTNNAHLINALAVLIKNGGVVSDGAPIILQTVLDGRQIAEVIYDPLKKIKSRRGE